MCERRVIVPDPLEPILPLYTLLSGSSMLSVSTFSRAALKSLSSIFTLASSRTLLDLQRLMRIFLLTIQMLIKHCRWVTFPRYSPNQVCRVVH